MRPTRVSVTARSVPSPKPWNSRSCIVGISFRVSTTALRAEQDDRVIQRPRMFYLGFVDADDGADIVTAGTEPRAPR
jgi:hypothetical protein